jgi:hypothetical protein
MPCPRNGTRHGGDDGSASRGLTSISIRHAIKHGRSHEFLLHHPGFIGGHCLLLVFTQTPWGQTGLIRRTGADEVSRLQHQHQPPTSSSPSRGRWRVWPGFYTLHFQFCSSGHHIDMTTTVAAMTSPWRDPGPFWGPMLGALVYVVLQNYLSDNHDRWPLSWV